ncbi:MAG: HAD family hydrolase [Dysosmobacter welbionis]
MTPENCLVIGDSLSKDIRGANNAGLPCCWYNPAGKARPEDLRIDYEIRDLRELLDIV